jgi:hypothetical protein
VGFYIVKVFVGDFVGSALANSFEDRNDIQRAFRKAPGRIVPP